MTSRIPFLSALALGLFIGVPALAQRPAVLAEAEGIDYGPVGTAATPSTANRLDVQVCTDAVLLVPNSVTDNVDLLDPTTGDLLAEGFLALPTDLATPINAIPNFDRDGIFVSDQIRDAVYEFDCDGNPRGVFAPAGGPDTNILDNVRGISLNPAGDELWVTVAAGPNDDTIARFGTDGTYLGTFVGALAGPFDVFPRASDVLISDIDADQITKADYSGTLLPPFASGVQFPEQIAQASNTNILVADFQSEDLNEFTADGTFVQSFPTGEGIRGVYELPSGNLLVTSGLGVTEYTRSGDVVRAQYASADRFIELFPPQTDVSITVPFSRPNAQPGGRVVFDVTGTNGSDETVTADLYVEVSGPRSLRVKLRTLTAAPGTSASKRYRVFIPDTTPPGSYTATVILGDFDAATRIASDSFTFEVTGTPELTGKTTDAAGLAVTVGPNPTRGVTTFSYDLPEGGDVRLAVYDALGREVAALVDGTVAAGSHTVTFDARGLPVGVYVYRFAVDGVVQTGEIAVVR